MNFLYLLIKTINIYSNKKVFIVFFAIFSAFLVHSQQENDTLISSISKLIELSDKYYGTDDFLANGRYYFYKHKNYNGHPFFGNNVWEISNLFVNGKKFNDVKLKYDVESDQLILKTKYNLSSVDIVLNDELVDSFNIQNHHFISSNQFEENTKLSHYFEIIYKGNFLFLIKHSKILINDYYNSPPYGKYTGLNSIFYIYNKGSFKKLPNKNTFLNYFKPFKREIKKFLKKNKIKYRKTNVNQLHVLLKYCDRISAE